MVAAIGAAALACGLCGCRGERTDEPPREFLPDMDDSPKFKPQMETDFFADGRSMRPLVAGTVAYGPHSDPNDVYRVSYLKEPTEVYTGVDPSKGLDKEGKPQFVALMPPVVLDQFIATSRDHHVNFDSREAAFRGMLERGKERFNIYCSVCHGYNAEGGNPAAFTGGQAGRRWAYPVPSLHETKYTDRKEPTGSDGYIFSTIRHGVADTEGKPPKMPSYADKVNEADAWAVVCYLRVLQASWQEDLKNVPSDLRPALERSRPALPPAAPAPGTPPAKQTSMAPSAGAEVSR